MDKSFYCTLKILDIRCSEIANCEKFNCGNDKILRNVELESEHICITFTGLTSNNITFQEKSDLDINGYKRSLY